ncbi:MAG: hypothetical protein ABIU77_24390 [Ferruginibacter sp.]
MKIELYQSGGYVGDRIKIKELNDTNMSVENVSKLKQYIKEADFFKIDANQLSSDQVIASPLIYELTIADGKKSKTVKAVSPSTNTHLSALLTFILGL